MVSSAHQPRFPCHPGLLSLCLGLWRRSRAQTLADGPSRAGAGGSGRAGAPHHDLPKPVPRRRRLAPALEVAGAARIERISRRAHVIDLHGGFEHVWTNRRATKARSGARKAEKHGVEARAYRGGEGVEVFYRLYLRSIDRWAERQHEPKRPADRRAAHRDPLAKLQHIAGTLRDACRIWIAWRLGQPIAGTIVLIGRNADYILGAMDKCLAGPVNANDLLHARAIEEACHLGCGRYHMGESGQSSSLAQYKQRLGALAFDYEEVHLERLPLTRTDRVLRGAVKRILGFRDT